MCTRSTRLFLVLALAVVALPLLAGADGNGCGGGDDECVFDRDCDDDELCEDGECVRDSDGEDGDEGEGEAGEGEGEAAGEGEGEGGEGGEGEGEGGVRGQPGSSCDCDGDCAGDGAGHAGACVLGICMQQPSGACSAGGSTAECAAGFQCWGLADSEGGFCWPDCASFDCAGTCDADGSCAPNADNACTESCSAFCGGAAEGEGEGEGEGECPPNSTLEPTDGFCYCDAGFIVVDNACVHECESNGDCTGGDVCTDNSCAPPPCTATSCDDGFVCASSGSCILDIGSPPPGPVPSCAASTPSFNCTGGEANCGAVVAFEPDEGPGYSDYALNGETLSNEYRSFIRRDVQLLIKYAAAATDCLSQNWTFGNQQPIGLGDMSEANGDIPGTSDGSPGHPAGTHEDGRDMDIGYFQLTSPDNHLRPICNHTSGGTDQYHCVAEPTELDVWRTALFIGKLHDSVQLRVIGVDGRAGPLVESAVDQLCDTGYLTGSACTGGLSLAYETVDEGAGWFHFHHHHFHISLMSRPEAGLATFLPPPRGLGRFACLDEGCHTVVDVATDPRRRVYGSTPVNPWKRSF